MSEAPTDKLTEIREQAIANRRASRRMDPTEAQLRLDTFREFVVRRLAENPLAADTVIADAQRIADTVVDEARRLKLVPE